jgi:NHL repeat/WD40-like Beta Propeller Repeat
MGRSERGRVVTTELGITDRRSGDDKGALGALTFRHSLGARTARYGRTACRWTAVLCVVSGASLAQSVPALAISQRGHAFSFHFGSFSDPAGVAVDDTSGDVYVANNHRKRVEEFEPVLVGSELVGETEVASWQPSAVPGPEAIAVDNSTQGSDPSSGDVYVVSNEKEVYKLSPEGTLIDTIKGPGGTAAAKKLASIAGIAVDSSGNLFVYEAGHQIYKFNDATLNEGLSEVQVPLVEPGRPGLAVDSEGNFYIGARVDSSSLQQTLLLNEVEEEFFDEQKAITEEPEGFAVAAKLNGSSDKIAIPAMDYEFSSAVAVNPTDEPGNDVSELNDVYVVNVDGVGSERTSTVAEFGPEAGEQETGKLIQRFGTPGLQDGDAIAVDAKTGTVFVADVASDADNVDVFQLEKAGQPTAEATIAESSPTIPGSETLSAAVDPRGTATESYFEYGLSSCTVQAACMKTVSSAIGAGFGDHTVSVQLLSLQPGSYHYRVVAKNTAGQVEGVERTFTVLTPIAGLPDGRKWELVSPPNKDGAEPEALTREGAAIQASENGDAIAYVADGPMPAGVGAPEPEGNRSPEYPQILSTRGSAGWSSRDITTASSTGSGVEAGEAPEYQFFSGNLALALVQPSPGAPNSGVLADPPLSPPLTSGEKQEKTIYLRDDAPLDSEEFVPLQPDSTEAVNYNAAQESGARMVPAKDPGYLALVSAENQPAPGAEFGGGLQEGLEFLGATPNLSHAVINSWKDQPGIYEWVGLGEPLKQISVLPETGTRVGPKEAFFGGPKGVDSRHAISSDGTRVIWTQDANNTFHLFVRDTATEETIQLDTFHGVSEQNQPEAEAIFQTANASGSKVFFTDTQRLTPNARAVEKAPDLYVAELQGGETAGSHLTATLTDLTPQAGAKVFSEGGGQGGGVLGASEEEGGAGFNVYFVADGALAPGASTGHCPFSAEETAPVGTTCNLYMDHYNGSDWQATKLIAVLSSEDRPDWQSTGQYDDLTELTSRVSPNGTYLAFMSDRSLTGYDNEDVSSKPAGERRLDEEVYLYDASSESLICASCNPSGAQPTGVLDRKNAGEGLGLVVDRPRTWETPGVDSWLAGSLPGWTSLSSKRSLYQSHYLSNEGRLFFNSADALVPVAQPTRLETVNEAELEVGVENVYEYEPVGDGGCDRVGGCVGLISSGSSDRESAFLDASADGNDVFFLTAASLVPQDADSNFDVYDAHVCEPASPCVTPSTVTSTSCEDEACHPSYSPQPTFAAPATATFSGSSNLVEQVHVLSEKEAAKLNSKPLTRAQKLAKALKTCRKDKQKKQRVACEKRAHKKYRPIKPNARKSTAKTGSER